MVPNVSDKDNQQPVPGPWALRWALTDRGGIVRIEGSESTGVPSGTGDFLAILRAAGTHPLMSTFPQGAIFYFDQDLRYLSAGGLGLSDVGLSSEILVGRTIFEVFPEETANAIEPLYCAALAGSPTTFDIPYEGRIYSQRLTPVTDASGAVVAGLGFTQDVTEARSAEADLRAAAERNRLTFEHAPIGKAVVGLDGGWQQANAAFIELLGYAENQLLRLTFQDITHPDDLDLDLSYLRQLLAGEIKSYQMEKRYFTAVGRTVRVLLSVALVRDKEDNPVHFIAQIQDLTDAKRQQLALQDLIGMLAHDLRSPATVILGFAEIMEHRPDLEVREVRDYIARIGTSARTMTALLDNALVATALDANGVLARPQSNPLRESVATAIRTVDLGSVPVDYSGVGEAVAWVDPVHLNQALTNLLSNAVKYGGDTVTISAETSEGRVLISIADNGPGVPPEFVPHLFDRFSRSMVSRSGSQRGSGLGLYIVRDLLGANGGTIRYGADSPQAPQGGAVFVIDLPSTAPGEATTYEGDPVTPSAA